MWRNPIRAAVADAVSEAVAGAVDSQPAVRVSDQAVATLRAWEAAGSAMTTAGILLGGLLVVLLVRELVGP